MTRITKLKLTPRTTMKAKAVTRLVGQVEAGNGISVTKEQGNFFVEWDSQGATWDGQPIAPNKGGTGQTSYTQGDLLYASSPSVLSRLAAGADGYLLGANGAGLAPSYQGFLQAGAGAVTRTWRERLCDWVSVRDFGAVGDGATDDTAAVQAALDHAGSINAAVYVPAGIYLVAGLVLPVTGVSPIRLYGDGMYASQLKLKAGAGTYILASSTYAESQSYVDYGPVIEDIGFVGNKAHQTGTSALLYMRTYRNQMKRVIITDSIGPGLVWTTLAEDGTPIAGGMPENICDECYVFDNGGPGIWVKGTVTDWTVINSAIYGNGGGAGWDEWGLRADFCPGAIVRGNRFYSNHYGNASLAFASLMIFADNHLEATGVSGGINVYMVTAGFAQLSITGNMLWDDTTSPSAPRYGFFLDKSSSNYQAITFAGNSIAVTHGSGNIAIGLSGFTAPDRVVLAGNALSGTVSQPLSDVTFAAVEAFNATDGQLLVGQTSAQPQPKTVSGDATVAASGALTIAAHAVSNGKLRQSAGASVIGRAAGTTGDVADIAAGTDGDVLRRAGGTLGFGSIANTSVTGLGTASTLNSDNDGTLAANSSTRVPTQAAVKAYADALIAANDAMVFRGVVDCSANPNYPAADRGHAWKVSVAGKIGGGSGIAVEVGDLMICTTDSTASGNHATVGTNWAIVQANLDGAVTGPASSTSGNVATYSGTGGKVIQDSGKALPSGTIVGTSDTQTITGKTISGASNTLTNVGGTSIRMGSDADGDILYFNGTDYVRLAKGSDGQALKLASGHPAWAASREVLTANRTYYVRTDGSDSNTGLTNTSGGAFLTIQKAINAVAALDLSSFNVTIQLGDGTYDAAVVVNGPWVGSGTVTLNGNNSTPSNVIVTNAASRTIELRSGARLTVSNLELRSGDTAFFVADGSAGTVGSGTVFGTCAGYHMRAFKGGTIAAGASYSINGGAAAHYAAQINGTIEAFAASVTLTGTPAFSVAFVRADRASVVSAPSVTFTGSATGVRADAQSNGVIATGGGGASYFPGNSANTTATGGQIV